jgi:hypothetical protein
MRGRRIKPTAGTPASNGLDTLLILFNGPLRMRVPNVTRQPCRAIQTAVARQPHHQRGRLHLTAGKQRGSEDD